MSERPVKYRTRLLGGRSARHLPRRFGAARRVPSFLALGVVSSGTVTALVLCICLRQPLRFRGPKLEGRLHGGEGGGEAPRT
jgi:hypothetical protein